MHAPDHLKDQMPRPRGQVWWAQDNFHLYPTMPPTLPHSTSPRTAPPRPIPPCHIPTRPRPALPCPAHPTPPTPPRPGAALTLGKRTGWNRSALISSHTSCNEKTREYDRENVRREMATREESGSTAGREARHTARCSVAGTALSRRRIVSGVSGRRCVDGVVLVARRRVLMAAWPLCLRRKWAPPVSSGSSYLQELFRL